MNVRGVLQVFDNGNVAFYCLGCDERHTVSLGEGPGPRWGFDGNYDRPTFTPSILIRSGHFVPGQEGKDCWCTYTERTGRELPSGIGCSVCHSFVTDGQIKFLGDCTHHLAGQTVPLTVPQPRD